MKFYQHKIIRMDLLPNEQFDFRPQYLEEDLWMKVDTIEVRLGKSDAYVTGLKYKKDNTISTVRRSVYVEIDDLPDSVVRGLLMFLVVGE